MSVVSARLTLHGTLFSYSPELQVCYSAVVVKREYQQAGKIDRINESREYSTCLPTQRESLPCLGRGQVEQFSLSFPIHPPHGMNPSLSQTLPKNQNMHLFRSYSRVSFSLVVDGV